jgi:hypothetical protein
MSRWAQVQLRGVVCAVSAINFGQDEPSGRLPLTPRCCKSASYLDRLHSEPSGPKIEDAPEVGGRRAGLLPPQACLRHLHHLRLRACGFLLRRTTQARGRPLAVTAVITAQPGVGSAWWVVAW